MSIFDRIFDGDDMPFVFFIDLVDESGERRRFARARRPGEEHEARRKICERANDRGQHQ